MGEQSYVPHGAGSLPIARRILQRPPLALLQRCCQLTLTAWPLLLLPPRYIRCAPGSSCAEQVHGVRLLPVSAVQRQTDMSAQAKQQKMHVHEQGRHPRLARVCSHACAHTGDGVTDSTQHPCTTQPGSQWGRGSPVLSKGQLGGRGCRYQLMHKFSLCSPLKPSNGGPESVEQAEGSQLGAEARQG